MNHKVWENFAERLSGDYTVYTPDLPGFGKSPLWLQEVTMPAVASKMNQWIEHLNIAPLPVIGHSMGGYVALEMIRQSPVLFNGLGLFHSTAKEDNEEKKESRTKVLRFIDDNGVLAFTSNFIPPLFADQNHPAIPSVKDITVEATGDSVKAYTKAMRDRVDNSQVLSNYGGEIVLIGGDSDKGIPASSLQEQANLNRKISLHIFGATGHMGMFEREEESLEAVRSFLRKIYEPDGA
jgi:pimeloyl-ACP methyl ester carboxylesterase